MKKLILFISFIAFVSCANTQNNTTQRISIIPEPVSVTEKSGNYILTDNLIIVSTENQELMNIAQMLGESIGNPTGYKVNVMKLGRGGIEFKLNRTADTQLGNEGYKLSSDRTGVTITANKPAGIFYGVQTLLQLLPKEIESASQVQGVQWAIPAVDITDYPRFGYRGMMFDVVRHYFTKEQVKEFIDDMVRYKYNMLHLHLTDDQGWRIEIKSLPKLTEVGAWRAQREGNWGSFTKPSPAEEKTYGGFYTHEDIRELVRYAQVRYVQILPEVDVPGHSLAAIAAYPELTCTPGKYAVNAGEKFMNWYTGGFSAMIDNNLCPTNEKVYTFLDKVFTEIAQLFPYEYIHMGGDEAAKNFWEKTPSIKAMMAKNKYKSMDEVQAYFVGRVKKIIESKGKKMIGWDEILEGGLVPGAAVMSWRGMKGGIEAAHLGHEVVMSPSTHTYLDLYQGDPMAEPAIAYAGIRLSQTYKFDPVPEGVDAKYILGGQANLWTERITNLRHAQYMLWPRAFAVAESVWSPNLKKDWNKFIGKIEDHFKRYDISETKYSRSMYDPIFTARKDAAGKLLIVMSTEIEGLDIYYTWDETDPDRFYPKYTSPLSVPKDARLLRVVTYRENQKVGKVINVWIDEMNKRAGIIVPKK